MIWIAWTKHPLTKNSVIYFYLLPTGQFPDRMRDKVKVDYDGRFYQDYYRTVVHHERRDEWHGLLQTLKAHFTGYLNDVMCQAQPGESCCLYDIVSVFVCLFVCLCTAFCLYFCLCTGPWWPWKLRWVAWAATDTQGSLHWLSQWCHVSGTARWELLFVWQCVCVCLFVCLFVYCIVMHHESWAGWHGLLQTLKAHFTGYLNDVMCQAQPGESCCLYDSVSVFVCLFVCLCTALWCTLKVELVGMGCYKHSMPSSPSTCTSIRSCIRCS